MCLTGITKSAFSVFHDAGILTQTLLAPYLGPTNPGAPFDPESLLAQCRFLMQQLKLLENLMWWRKYTGGRVGIGELASKPSPCPCTMWVMPLSHTALTSPMYNMGKAPSCTALTSPMYIKHPYMCQHMELDGVW